MEKTVRYNNLEDVYKDVYGIVEATSFEALTLWQYYHQEKGYSWIQNNSGWLECIGKLADREVWISPLAHIVNSKKILFVEATSSVVDWDMIEDYLKEHVPSAIRENGFLRKENAINFHNLIY